MSGLGNPIQNFSGWSAAPYALADKTIAGVDFKKGQPFGMFRVLGDMSANFDASSVQNRGGNSYFPRASEVTEINPVFTMSVKESPNMLFSLYGGADITKTAASATGTIVAIKNIKGTSIVASTGIATATIESGKETDLGLNVYIVKVVGPDSVDVYAMTDLEFRNGDDLSFIDEDMKITATPLTIVQSAAVSVPNSGVELTGDSGVIAMVTGDTAVYKTVAPHGGISTATFGQAGLTFPEFGIIVYSKPRGDGSHFELEIYKVQSASGMLIPFSETGFQISDLTMNAILNEAPLDGSGVAKVWEIRSILPAA